MIYTIYDTGINIVMFNEPSTTANAYFLVEFESPYSCTTAVAMFENGESAGCDESSIEIDVVSLINQDLMNGKVNLVVGSYDVNIYMQDNNSNMDTQFATYWTTATFKVITKNNCII